MHNFSVDELPERPEDVEKLARRLGYPSGAQGLATELFLKDMEQRTARTREIFLEIVERERVSPLAPHPGERGQT